MPRMQNKNNPPQTSSVFVALVGRPNVGKSSLTNTLVGEKVAIVTKKPQTTRSRITGVITKGPVQYVLMDTPGIHTPRNKLDLLRGFAELEARRQQIESLGVFENVYTISAKDGTGCDELLESLTKYGTEGPHYFDDDAFTDMPEKELVAELIREKLLLFMRDEVPHGVAVTVESFKERTDKDLIDISVEICCERKSHKGMIIGKGGQMLKKIASAARADCEELLGTQIHLQCWVKVREGWRDSERLLDDLGFAKP